MAGRGRKDGGNSGRPPRPVNLGANGPIQLLRQIVRDEGASRRERVTAANSLLLHEARRTKVNRKSKAQKLFEDAMEAGWFSPWHRGWDDGTPPDDPSYGTCLLDHTGDWRDPKGPPFRRKWPPEAEYRSRMEQTWEARNGRLPGERKPDRDPPDDE